VPRNQKRLVARLDLTAASHGPPLMPPRWCRARCDLCSAREGNDFRCESKFEQLTLSKSGPLHPRIETFKTRVSTLQSARRRPTDREVKCPLPPTLDLETPCGCRTADWCTFIVNRWGRQWPKMPSRTVVIPGYEGRPRRPTANVERGVRFP